MSEHHHPRKLETSSFDEDLVGAGGMRTDASDDDLVGAGIIWSFWEGQTPDLVLRCFESIRIHNPTRPFIVLNRATLPKFVDLTVDFPLFRGKRGTPDDFSSVQIFADWVRLKLLDKYGGVWLDASIICTSPVDNWIANGDHNTAAAAALLYDDDEDEMQIQQLGSVKNIIHMFPMHANPNVHASWAMAAMEPGNPVIQAWLQEMNDILNETGSLQEPLDYIKRVMTENNEVCERWNTPQTPPLPYLWVYLALQVVLHRQPDLHSHICLHSSVDGPIYRRYMYNVEHEIQDATEVSRATADHLAMEPPNIDGPDRWFIKLVGTDRQPIQEHLDNRTYRENSCLDRLSKLRARSIIYGANVQIANLDKARATVHRIVSDLEGRIGNSSDASTCLTISMDDDTDDQPKHRCLVGLTDSPKVLPTNGYPFHHHHMIPSFLSLAPAEQPMNF